MASLDYGMYGYNVLVVNGESSDLPFCTIGGTNAQSLPTPVYFTTVLSDPYEMAIKNGTGTFGAIRTSVAGTYRIRSVVNMDGGAGTGVGQLIVYASKQGNLNASGLYDPDTSGVLTYIVGEFMTTINTSGSGSAIVDKTIFLEKDCYISAYVLTNGGTAPSVKANTNFSSELHVQCLAVENSGKRTNQT